MRNQRYEKRNYWLPFLLPAIRKALAKFDNINGPFLLENSIGEAFVTFKYHQAAIVLDKQRLERDELFGWLFDFCSTHQCDYNVAPATDSRGMFFGFVLFKEVKKK